VAKGRQRSISGFDGQGRTGLQHAGGVGATLPAMDGETHDGIDDETFEDWVMEAIDGLPDTFRERLGGLGIMIEDEPSVDDLRRLGIPGMYGLFVGVPRSAWMADWTIQPSRITIYRGPCLRSATTREGVRDRVQDTVRHEIAHHFGISDERLHELAREHGGH
jgi:predicted Zn-dependent protease with MMP-like domain